MLKRNYRVAMEAGLDEAGRGCLAGPVFAAAVVFPPEYSNMFLDDSKKLSSAKRALLRREIEANALCWATASVDHREIDEMNILNASIKAMHLAVDQLNPRPAFLLVDGNRFVKYPEIAHRCFVKGDATYISIAAASILAKVARDEFMLELDELYPEYGWRTNKGYPTPGHFRAIAKHGVSPYHRRSFSLIRSQLRMF